ncbi:MAG TPA: hypothetical protein VHX88_11915 [Solirubrobacteraceae bacterium]|nr:hypothetical protein [Solirubrobacteraceae bacterium]
MLSVDVNDRTSEITIRQWQPEGVYAVGTFADAAKAWAAVDALDAPIVEEQPVAAIEPRRQPRRRSRLRLRRQPVSLAA